MGASKPEPDACPLCSRTKGMRKPRKLYGANVCKKCVYGFVNRRQLAFALDWLVLELIAFVAVSAIGIIWTIAALNENLFDVVLWGVQFAVIGFFCIKDGMGGYSPGKFLTGVQVMDLATGKPIGPGASLKRNLLLYIPFMPLVALVQMTKGPRIGDRWAGTRVIWKKYRKNPVFAVGPQTSQLEKSEFPTADATNVGPDERPVGDEANPYQAPLT
jgi:uncharacterized RDD family membrane protein YckC